MGNKQARVNDTKKQERKSLDLSVGPQRDAPSIDSARDDRRKTMDFHELIQTGGKEEFFQFHPQQTTLYSRSAQNSKKSSRRTSIDKDQDKYDMPIQRRMSKQEFLTIMRSSMSMESKRMAFES